MILRRRQFDTLYITCMVVSAELQPTNPSVELITRSLLKTQTRLFTPELGSADISKLFKFWTTPPSAHEAETLCSVLLHRALLAPLHQPQSTGILLLGSTIFPLPCIIMLPQYTPIQKGLSEEACPAITTKDTMGQHHGWHFKGQTSWDRLEVLLAQ